MRNASFLALFVVLGLTFANAANSKTIQQQGLWARICPSSSSTTDGLQVYPYIPAQNSVAVPIKAGQIMFSPDQKSVLVNVEDSGWQTLGTVTNQENAGDCKFVYVKIDPTIVYTTDASESTIGWPCEVSGGVFPSIGFCFKEKISVQMVRIDSQEVLLSASCHRPTLKGAGQGTCHW